MLDLDSFLVSLYVLVDDWWKLKHSSEPPRTGRPALLTDPEVITLAILAQWPRWRSERDFWRFAHAHLRPYFPNLCSQSQLNRRVRSVAGWFISQSTSLSGFGPVGGMSLGFLIRSAGNDCSPE